MITFKKYKGSVDLDIIEKLVNEFLKKYPEAEVRSMGKNGYQLLLGNEGMDFGTDSDKPSTLFFHAKNPTQISLDFAKELAEKLELNIILKYPGSGKTEPVGVENLKLEHL